MRGILLTTAAAAIFLLARRAKKLPENLAITPLKITIDSARSAASLFTRIYYTVTIEVDNPEPIPIPIRAALFKVYVQDIEVGRIVSNQAFTIPARARKSVQFTAAITSTAVIQAVRELINNGLKAQVYIEGSFDTLAGQINFEFTKDLGIQ